MTLEVDDVGQAGSTNALASTLQHRRREVDAGDLGVPIDHRQLETGADPDVEDVPARPAGSPRTRAAPCAHHQREGEVVDRRPSRVCGLDARIVERTRLAAQRASASSRASAASGKRVARTVPPPSTRAPGASLS